MHDLALGHRGLVRAGRLRAFTSEEAAYKAGMWFLATRGHVGANDFCKRNNVPVLRAQAEGVNSAGGFLVPVELQKAIVQIRELTGAFRAAADIRPMAGDASSIPRRTGGITAFFASEGSSLSASKSQLLFDAVGLVAKKLATFTVVSSELDEDSVIDIGEFLAVEAGYSFAIKEDDCGFNGDGTSTYGGMKGIATLFGDGNHNAGKYTATGHSTFDSITATDLGNLIGLAPAVSLGRSAWFTSPMGFGLMFSRLTAAAGGCSVMPDMNGRLRPYYLGWPIITSQGIVNTNGGTGKLLAAFGDLSMAATLGDRREVTLFRSADGVNLFENDAVGYRVTERIDVVVHDLGDNTTAGPIVGLIAG